MKRIVPFLSRMLLIVGVMIALTPCGFCHKGQVDQTCALANAQCPNCCHHTASISVCPIMDQLSESGVVPAPHLDIVLASPVTTPTDLLQTSFSNPLQTSSRSFHRSPLVLRI